MAGIVTGIDERVKEGNKRTTYVVRGRREVTSTDSSNYEDAENVENHHPNPKRTKLSSVNSTNIDGKSHDGRDHTLIESSGIGYDGLYNLSVTGGVLNQSKGHLAATGVRIVDWSTMSNVVEETVAETDCRNCALLKNELEICKIRIKRLEDDLEFQEEENRLLRIENQELKEGNYKSNMYIEPTHSRVTQIDEGNLSDVQFVDDSSLEVIPEEEKGDSDNDRTENRTVVANNEQVEAMQQENSHEGQENVDQGHEELRLEGNSLERANEDDGSRSPVVTAIGQAGGKKECGFCGKRFANLARHMKTHTMEKPYQCSVCAHAFSQRGNLKTHERTHNGERPYKCRSCQLSFARSDTLKDHERIHSGEQPYECQYCGRRFADGSSRRRHEMIHTKQKPHRCQLCDKAFTKLSQLKGHSIKKHNQRP